VAYTDEAVAELAEQQQSLDALLLRRRQLIEMRTMERNCLRICRDARSQTDLQQHIAWLDDSLFSRTAAICPPDNALMFSTNQTADR
jgi:transposase